jgi:hypothetical protein
MEGREVRYATSRQSNRIFFSLQQSHGNTMNGRRKRLNQLLVIILVGLATNSAWSDIPRSAGAVTAKQLLAWCESPDELGRGMCMGFLIALENYSMVSQYDTKPRACLPGNVAKDELRDLVVMVLKSLQDRQDDSAATLVMEAMASAYPCASHTRISTR